VVVWGGSKDVGKNETKQGITWVQSFVETNKHTNIILMEVPHRHDFIEDSCLNKEVEKLNSIMRKHVKVHENAGVVKVNLDRRAFTKHSQHMNAMGKELMVKRIIEAIKHSLKVCTKALIFMKWKEDTNKDKRDPGEAKNGVRERRDTTENRMIVFKQKRVTVENKKRRQCL